MEVCTKRIDEKYSGYSPEAEHRCYLAHTCVIYLTISMHISLPVYFESTCLQFYTCSYKVQLLELTLTHVDI